MNHTWKYESKVQYTVFSREFSRIPYNNFAWAGENVNQNSWFTKKNSSRPFFINNFKFLFKLLWNRIMENQKMLVHGKKKSSHNSGSRKILNKNVKLI